MRHSRIKADGAGYYHCMSRIIEQRMILGKAEKERFLKLMLNPDFAIGQSAADARRSG